MTACRWYFAYGSNLNLEHWRGWCLDNHFDPNEVRQIEPGHLPDMELAFARWSPVWAGGVLDLREHAGSSVPGMLCEVGRSGWQALDSKEGAPRAYRRVELVATTGSGVEVPVVTYRVAEPVPFVDPNPRYLEIVRRGLEACGLTTDHLLRAARAGAP